MKFSWRMIAAAFSYALGVLGWCYVGGYKILTGPVRELILAPVSYTHLDVYKRQPL